MSDVYHTIRGGETLQSIAARYYGSHAAWRSLVGPNNLRPPYISDNPLDQYGSWQASFVLAQTVSPGASRLTLTSDNSDLLRFGARLVLEQRVPQSNTLIRETALVLSYSVLAVNLQAPLQNTFYANSTLAVYPPEIELRGRVLRSGDILVVPNVVAASAAVADPAKHDSIYGRDIASTPAGQLILDEAGDLLIASGATNLVQQLERRVRTVQGTLYRHTDYGCRAEQFIGQAALPETLLLIEAWVGLALARDPRVESVAFVAATVVQDAIMVKARVNIHDASTDINLSLTT